MKTEDTVMTGRITSLTDAQQKIVDRLLNEQAERTKIMLKEQWKQEGRREVVDWVEANSKNAIDMGATFRLKWQAFKKEK